MPFYHIYKKHITQTKFERKNFFFICKNVKLWPAIEPPHEVLRQSLKIRKYLRNLSFNMRKRFYNIRLTLRRLLRSKDTLLREFPEIRDFWAAVPNETMHFFKVFLFLDMYQTLKNISILVLAHGCQSSVVRHFFRNRELTGSNL